MYSRYRIETRDAPPVRPQPNKFRVKVDRKRFLRMVSGIVLSSRSIGELRGKLKSRPCVYGVYDGLMGGLKPKEERCVGCLRCMVEHPEVVSIDVNTDYENLGDTYWSPQRISTVLYEAATGKILVRGAGYGGPFSGSGWDSMWTDMSEIVRPTRDGIHGREFISTSVDLGRKPNHLEFASDGTPSNGVEPPLQVPIPIIFDRLPTHLVDSDVQDIVIEAASRLGTLVIVPVRNIAEGIDRLRACIVPSVSPDDLTKAEGNIIGRAKIVELQGTQEAEDYFSLRRVNREAVLVFRLPFSSNTADRVVELAGQGVGVFHLFCDYQGKTLGEDAGFIKDAIREVHLGLVEESIRDEVTIIASGGIIMAEHVPKAVICGADAVALETPLLVAVQCGFNGEWASPDDSQFRVPEMEKEWGVTRVTNLVASWHAQLLEILGAMGMREVRRLRGEVGRAMFVEDLEREIFKPLFGDGQ